MRKYQSQFLILSIMLLAFAKPCVAGRSIVVPVTGIWHAPSADDRANGKSWELMVSSHTTSCSVYNPSNVTQPIRFTFIKAGARWKEIFFDATTSRWGLVSGLSNPPSTGLEEIAPIKDCATNSKTNIACPNIASSTGYHDVAPGGWIGACWQGFWKDATEKADASPGCTQIADNGENSIVGLKVEIDTNEGYVRGRCFVSRYVKRKNGTYNEPELYEILGGRAF